MLNKRSLPIIIILLIVIGAVLWNFFQNENVAKNNQGTKVEYDESKIKRKTYEPIEIGKPAPDFELKTLQDKTIKLSDYKGKIVFLNFWATWCPPCKDEMPDMQNFYDQYKDQGVEILAVNLTKQDNGIDKIKKFVDDFGLTFEIPLDEDGYTTVEYQASFGIPISYVIDKNGHIAQKITGPMNEEMMIEIVNNLNES